MQPWSGLWNLLDLASAVSSKEPSGNAQLFTKLTWAWVVARSNLLNQRTVGSTGFSDRTETCLDSCLDRCVSTFGAVTPRRPLCV